MDGFVCERTHFVITYFILKNFSCFVEISFASLLMKKFDFWLLYEERLPSPLYYLLLCTNMLMFDFYFVDKKKSQMFLQRLVSLQNDLNFERKLQNKSKSSNSIG